MLLKACLNGARDIREHPALSAEERVLSAQAADAVAAGAGAIHVHPKDAEGRDSMDAGDVARWITAMRAACPGIPIGVTTGAWIAPRVATRREAIAEWTHLPDFASVNWHEDDADDIAALLLSRGIGVEAGIWHDEGADAWLRSPVRGACLRVLIELPDIPADELRDRVEALLTRISRAEPDIPILLHGEARSTWPALDLAVERGLDARIGLEDCLTLPDGSVAADNAALVRAVLDRRRGRAGRISFRTHNMD